LTSGFKSGRRFAALVKSDQSTSPDVLSMKILTLSLTWPSAWAPSAESAYSWEAAAFGIATPEISSSNSSGLKTYALTSENKLSY